MLIPVTTPSPTTTTKFVWAMRCRHTLGHGADRQVGRAIVHGETRARCTSTPEKVARTRRAPWLP